MAARTRSAAFAYRIGSPRHDSRYSAIGISVSLRASNDRANALNRESLYMSAPHAIATLLYRAAQCLAQHLKPNTNHHQHIGPLNTPPTPPHNAQRGQRASHKQAFDDLLCAGSNLRRNSI